MPGCPQRRRQSADCQSAQLAGLTEENDDSHPACGDRRSNPRRLTG
jgi:hypothetical protein